MNRLRAVFCVAALLLGIASAGSVAQERSGPEPSRLVLSGTVAPRVEATVELLPYLDAYRSGRLRLDGHTDPDPVVSVPVGEGGRFFLSAPEPGVYRLVVRAPGHLPMMLQPLVVTDSRELPPVALAAAVPRTVRLVDERRQPIADAWLLAEGEPGPASGWRPDFRVGRTDVTGSVVLPALDGESLEVTAWPTGARAHEWISQASGEWSLSRSGAVERRLRVVGPDGEGISRVLIRTGDRLWPRGLTEGDGRASLVVGKEPVRLLLLAADGRRRLMELPAVTGDGGDGPHGEVTVELDAPRPVVGRLVTGPGRRPVEGAVVWSRLDPGIFAFTDGAGTYRLTAPRVGPLVLQAEAVDRVPTPRRLGPGQVERGRVPTFGLRPGVALAGTVTDAQGRPLPGVHLAAVLRQPRRPFASPDPADARALSDDSGRFRLAGLTPGAPYQVVASLDGHGTEAVEVRTLTDAASTPQVALTLRPARRVFGRVVDGEDRPVPGASIELTAHGIAPVLHPEADDPHRALTDADGVFGLARLPADEVDARVTAPELAPLVVRRIRGAPTADGGATDLGTFVLVPGEAIVGRVIDGRDRPVAGASVRVFDRGIAARPARWRSRISGPPQAVTGEDGRFRLAGLPAGSLHDLQILANGFQPVVLEGIEAPTERPVQLVLEPAAEVAGRVVDAREEAVEGARVSVVLVSLHPDLEREVASELVEDRTVLTDAEGRFALSELRPGKGSLTVVADGHLRPEPIPLDLEEGSRHDGILVRVLEGARIEGRVVTEDGEPVEGVRVAVEDSGGFTDADGTYGFDGVPIGQMEIAASHPRYHHELREVDVEPGINSVDWTFPVGRAVAGRVTDPAGDPVSGAVVRLATEEGVGGRELRTIAAADGGFRFDPVPSDEYRLEGEAPGFSATVAPDPVRVADRSLDGLQLTLRPGVLLTGRVTGLDAEALSRVRVEVSAADDGRTLDASVDWEGVYELRDLSPGDWRLRASLERDRRQVEARVPIDPGAGTVRRDLVFTDGSTLSGTVLYDAEPLMGASVSVRGLTSGLERSVRTDLDGRFEIADLEPGRYWLGVVHRPRRVIHNAEVELDASRDLSIDVSATTLEGQVTDARTGQPLERARVELRRADGVVGAEGLTLVVTDTAGAYYVARLTAGPYELTVHRDGYAPLYRSLAIAARPGSEVLDFSLEPARGLELLVQGVGPPPSHLDVLVEGPGGGWIERGRRRVAPDGRVSLSTLADGSWRLLVARPDGAPVPLQVTVPSTAPVPVDLPPATPVRVVVPDLRSSARIAQLRIFVPDGTPVSLVDLTVGLRDTWPLEAGRAAVGALPPGAYTFEVLGADGGRWVSTYEIGSGGGPLEVVVGSPTDTPPRS